MAHAEEPRGVKRGKVEIIEFLLWKRSRQIVQYHYFNRNKTMENNVR